MLCISDQGVGLNLFQSLMIGMVSSRLGWGFPFCRCYVKDLHRGRTREPRES